MTIVIISVVAAWILFSALLVTIICMNSSRLSRIDEPFKDPIELAIERKEFRDSILDIVAPVQEVYLCAVCWKEKDLTELATYGGMCGSCFQGKCDDANKPLVDDEEDDPGPGHTMYQ